MAYLSKHETQQSLKGLKPGPRALLVEIWRRQGSNGGCMPTTDSLARELGVSRRTIFRWKAPLIALGKIASTQTRVLKHGLHWIGRCVLSLVKPADQKRQQTKNIIEVAKTAITLPKDGAKNGTSITRQYIKSGLENNSEVAIVSDEGDRWSKEAIMGFYNDRGKLPKGIHWHQLR